MPAKVPAKKIAVRPRVVRAAPQTVVETPDEGALKDGPVGALPQTPVNPPPTAPGATDNTDGFGGPGPAPTSQIELELEAADSDKGIDKGDDLTLLDSLPEIGDDEAPAPAPVAAAPKAAPVVTPPAAPKAAPKAAPVAAPKAAPAVQPVAQPHAFVPTAAGPMPVLGKAGTIVVTRRYPKTSDIESANLEVQTFASQPATVTVGYGATLKIGDFEFAKVEVSVTLPCYPEEIAGAYEAARVFADDRLQKEVIDIRGGEPTPLMPAKDTPKGDQRLQPKPAPAVAAPDLLATDLAPGLDSVAEEPQPAPSDGLEAMDLDDFASLPEID